jgi:hypothetical protein
MSARQANQQPDLLIWSAKIAERERLPPEIRATVIGFLKRLLTECLSNADGEEPSDE